MKVVVVPKYRMIFVAPTFDKSVRISTASNRTSVVMAPLGFLSTEHQPRADVDLKYAGQVRTARLVPDAVDAEVCELMANAGPLLVSKGSLGIMFI